MTTPLTGLDDHPAIAAWTLVRGSAHDATEVVTLKDLGYPKKKSLYRLVGAGPDGSDVVAKRQRRRKAAIEVAVYEHVLPHVPGRSAAYYGLLMEENTRFWWLFFEHVSAEPFLRERDDHRVLVDEWLAHLHMAAAGLSKPENVPSKGVEYYLELLLFGKRRITELLAAKELGDAEREALTDAFAQLELVEQRWSDIAELCAGFPETLIHGDFLEKNLAIGSNGELVPFDWASAGWGVPGADLLQVDADRYCELVSGRWPEISVEACEGAATAGLFYWHVRSIRAAVADIPGPRWQKLDHHRQKLAQVLQELA